MDFRNTIAAINTPDDIKEEVDVYLGLVEKEANKQTPSREIILGNLRNASKLSDAYIASALGKPSNVVESWITTIFQQNIDLKANPDEINPDYLLKFPQKQAEKPAQAETVNTAPKEEIKQQDAQIKIANAPEIKEQKVYQIHPQKVEEAKTNENIIAQSSLELLNEEAEDIPENNNFVQEENIFIPKRPARKENAKFAPKNENDKTAKTMYIKARNLPKTQQGNTDALNILNDALGLIEDDETVNPNIRAAIHFERGKIFDEYDYVDYALRDYYEATKCDELNLKANAFYKSGSIYDEFREFDPALDNYISSVAYSGEADNMNGQSKALSKIAGLYAKRYDSENVENYVDLSIDSAIDSDNPKTIANAYSQGAQNYQYIGQNELALENYKNAIKTYLTNDEDYEQMAYNYEQAAIVMEKLGNEAKAKKLQARSVQYYKLAQRKQESLV